MLFVLWEIKVEEGELVVIAIRVLAIVAYLIVFVP